MWKGGKKFVASITKTVTNPDGTQFEYEFEDNKTVKFLEQDQEIDTAD